MKPSPSPVPTGGEPAAGMITWDGGGATILAAAIAAVVVLIGYSVQQSISRREHRDVVYAEAVRVVHDYLEAPYRVRRRNGSRQDRSNISAALSDIQSRLAMYETLMFLRGQPDVATAYSRLIRVARSEVGPQIESAWKARAARADAAVLLGRPYEQPRTREALGALIESMGARQLP